MPGHAGFCWQERSRLLDLEEREQPSRRGTSLGVVCYPDTYAAGMASLGFHVIHRLFSELPGWAIHRAFGLSEPYQQCLVRGGAGAGTLEGAVPLGAARLLAFSLPYSLLYQQMVALLMAGGVPLFVRERTEGAPVVVAGGAAVTINPEPIAPFVDLAVIGEAELSVPRLLRIVQRWERGEITRHTLWEEASLIPGVYAPEVMDVQRITRWDVPLMEETNTVSSFLSPLSHFRESVLLEVSRGCPCSCRFCVVGSLYRPVRWRRPGQVIELVEASGLRASRVSLIGAAVSVHPSLVGILEELVRKGWEVGLSSLRVDRYTSELASVLSGGGVRTVTMAPEAGSERLRTLIGKSLSDAAVLRAVASAVRGGVSKIRLYFMLGLPWETYQDRRAIVTLCTELASVVRGSSCLLVPSLAPFVPKPMTAFAWCDPPPEEELRGVIQDMLRQLGRIPHVQPRAGSPRLALADYRLSVGGRELGESLQAMVSEGLSWRQWLRRTEGMEAHLPWHPWGPRELVVRGEWEATCREALAR